MYDPIYMTFWKSKTIGIKKQTSGCQGLGMKGGFDCKGEQG